MAITGVNFVRFTRHGLQAIRAYWAKLGDRFEGRRQALKLRFWDERHLHPRGMLFDDTYESIKSLPRAGFSSKCGFTSAKGVVQALPRRWLLCRSQILKRLCRPQGLRR